MSAFFEFKPVFRLSSIAARRGFSPAGWLARRLLPHIARHAGWEMRGGQVFVPAERVIVPAPLSTAWDTASASELSAVDASHAPLVVRDLKGASRAGVERPDKLLCVFDGCGAHAFGLCGLGGIWRLEKLGPEQVSNHYFLEALHVQPGLRVVWSGHGPEQEEADHVGQCHLVCKFLIQPLAKSVRWFLNHIDASVRVLRAGLKGDGAVAAGHPRHFNDAPSDLDMPKGGAA